MTHCDNCGSPREGRFCSQCGQNDRDYLRNMFPVTGEIIAETLEVDSRLFRTLRALFLRPGFLSAEFSRNHRASYIPPVRLYLVSSLLFFFALSLSIDLSWLSSPQPPGADVMREEFGIPDDEKDGASIPQEHSDGELHPLERIQKRRAERQAAEGQESGDENNITLDELKAYLGEGGPEKVDAVVQFYGPIAESLLTGINIDLTAEGAPEDLNLFIIGQVVEIMYRPEAAAYRLLDALPVAMFLMLPFFALWLKIVYFTKHRYYVEHLVFSIHVHCVEFVGFTIIIFAGERAWIEIPVFLAMIAYLFLALKAFYQDTWKWTLAKFIFLTGGYFLLLWTFALGVVLVMFVTL